MLQAGLVFSRDALPDGKISGCLHIGQEIAIAQSCPGALVPPLGPWAPLHELATEGLMPGASVDLPNAPPGI